MTIEREPGPGRPPAGPGESESAEVRARIAALEREAKALEPDPRSARLYHELGLLWERPLGNLRAAAAAFQAAYRLAPRFVENLRSARRIFSDVGNWPMVLQLLEAELAATEGPRLRAALLFEKAEVLADRLDRWDAATGALAGALELEPADLGLLVQAEGMLAAHGDVAGLLRVQSSSPAPCPIRSSRPTRCRPPPPCTSGSASTRRRSPAGARRSRSTAATRSRSARSATPPRPPATTRRPSRCSPPRQSSEDPRRSRPTPRWPGRTSARSGPRTRWPR